MKSKACVKCGAEFERKQRAEKYCSDICRMQVIREKAALANARPERKEAIKENVKRWRRRLQSTPEGRAKLAAYIRPQTPREPKAKACKVCGSEFLTQHANTQICSDACRKAVHRIQNKRLAEKRLNDPEAHKKHREHMKAYMRERARKLREQKANSTLALTAQIKVSKDAITAQG